MANQTIAFSFAETEPDQSTFFSRFQHFLKLTDPRNFFVADQEILEGVDTVRKYKALAKESENGVIQITADERAAILRGIELMNSSCNDQGNLVFKPARLCGFVPLNVPIICGMMLAPPTIWNTVFFQWINQTYNANMNFGNKNSTCKYTNSDMMMGYAAACISSVGMGVTLRKLTAGIASRSSGKKLFFINFVVSAVSSGSAGFCNSLCMRYPEIKKGIKVYSDEKLENCVGISVKSAESAVYETASSRFVMSLMAMGIPTFIILSLGSVGLVPKAKLPKSIFEVLCISCGLYLGLPISVSVFPSLTIKNGTDLEEEFHKHEKIFFNKGL